MLRKITSVFIIAAIFLSSFCINTGALVLEYDDTRLDVLKGLEIVNGYEDEEKLLNTMSKSTFINFLLNMIYGGKYQAGFDEDALKTAEAMGIIDSAALVSVSDTLKGEEAVKMAMCLLGYKELCMRMGGYPTGYITKAASVGLTKGISVKASEMSNAEAYKLLYNTMTAGIVEVDAFKVSGDDYTQYYSEYENVTILNAYRGIYEVEGVVTANHTSDIYGDVEAAVGSIKIDEKRYEDSDGLLYDSLGYRVRAYAQRITGDTYKIVYAEIHNKAKIEKIETENVKNVSSDIKEIEYFQDKESERAKKASIKSSVSLLYNNVVYSDYTAEDFKAPNGELILIDNDGDNIIDVIKLNVYKIMIVSSVSAPNKIINNEYTKYEGVLEKLELEKYNSDSDRISFFLNGETVSLEDIQQGDVLSVFESKDGGNKNIEIYISREKATAQVTAYDMADKEVISDDIIYELSDTYFAANDKNESFAQTISPGGTYELYFDLKGKVVGAKLASVDDLSYGYLRKTTEIPGMDAEYAVRLFGEDGEWRNISLASKVKVNDKGRLNAASAKAEADNYIGYIIGYELDNDGKIKHLELPVLYSEDVSEERLTMTQDESGRRWRYNNTSFDSYHYMTGDTRVFVIPSEELDNEDLYDIGNNYSFTSDELISSYTGYGVDEFGFLDIALIRRDASTSKKVGDTKYFVREVGAAVDSEGTVTPQITVASSAYLGLSISAEDESVIAGVNPGDIIKIHVNAKGYIDNVTHVYKISDKDTVKDTPADLHTYTAVKGNLLKADIANGRILLDSSRKVALKISQTVPVLIYDVEREDVKAGSANDLTKDDYIIADISKSLVSGLYVFRNFEE